MEFHLFPVFTFLALTLLVASHAAHVSPQAYWNSVLPNSPMPKAVKRLLPSSGDAGGFARGGFSFSLRRGDINTQGNYGPPPSRSDEIQHYVKLGQTFFFLEKDMKQGTVLNLDLAKYVKGGVTFIPREASQSMPFSSEKITDVLNQFSFAPNSKEAELVKQTIRECEEPPLAGEHKYCATSLEAMVDYSTSMLGKNVRALSTELSKETGLQKYTFTETKKLGGRGDGEIAVCHMQNYAYAVFYCHNVHSTTAYAVTLAGADGTKGKAVAVCHHDTSSWNPMHISFQMLRVKPGTATICHILPEDNIIWVPLK